jgi:lipopolysaccharide transport system permease protein
MSAVEPRPIVIAPSSGWRSIDLREVWEYRELLFILVGRDIKVRYRQTLLGVLWVVAQPLMTALIFTVLFNRVAKIDAGGGIPYSLFVMVALVPWSFFSAGVSASGNSLIGSSHLISKVYFPRVIVPAASVLSGFVDMAVTLALVIVMSLVYRAGVPPQIVFLPVAILICALFAFGIGLWLSALNVEYRDIRVVIPFLLQLWMYATPVVYPLRVIPEKYRWVALINPLTGIVETFRAAMLGGAIPWMQLGNSVVVMAVVLVSGAFYFRRMERLFADVL